MNNGRYNIALELFRGLIHLDNLYGTFSHNMFSVHGQKMLLTLDLRVLLLFSMKTEFLFWDGFPSLKSLALNSDTADSVT